MLNFISPNTTIRLNSKILPVIVLILFILVIVDGYRGWVILLIPLGGTWLFATIWAYNLAIGLKIRREMRLRWTQVGDRMEEYFTLSNTSRLPALWVEVIGQTNMPDYWANQVRAVNRESETRWLIRGVCNRRGEYTLGPTSIYSHDPFGLYTVNIHNPESTTLVVVPPVVPLPFIRVSPGGRHGEGNLQVKTLDQDINSAGVREYFPGDNMRVIHWPTSVRKNAIYVRDFDHSPAGDWWIILDLDQAVQVGDGQNATQEHAIILGASLTDWGMRTGRSVSLAAYGKELVWHRPQLSDAYKWEILRSLALVEPGKVPLGELLALVHPSANPKTSLIIITPAVEGKWLPSLLAIQRLGVVPTVLLFNLESFGGSGESIRLLNKLTALGIRTQMISRDWLQRNGQQIGGAKNWGQKGNSEGRFVHSL